MCWSSAKTGKAGEKEEKTLDGAARLDRASE